MAFGRLDLGTADSELSYITSPLTKWSEGRGVNIDVDPPILVDDLQPHDVRPLGKVGAGLYQI